MECQLCKISKANKKNTHYLTDAIIRRAINEDGSNKRDKALAHGFSGNSNFLNIKIQRSTNPEKIQQTIGRQLNKHELIDSKSNSFSVDEVFCSSCENKFTVIENDFITNIQPIFNNLHLDSSLNKIEISNSKLFRKFMLLQIWRTSVCDVKFTIPTNESELIRNYILNNVGESKIRTIPISVYFYKTPGEEINKTRNLVAVSIKSKIIMFGEYVILCHSEKRNKTFFPFHGLTEKKNFEGFINSNEKDFIVKLIDDATSQQINISIVISEWFEPKLNNYRNIFKMIYLRGKGENPSKKLVEKYIRYLMKTKEGELPKLDEQNVLNKTLLFLRLLEIPIRI